jgi:hypothetical protein
VKVGSAVPPELGVKVKVTLKALRLGATWTKEPAMVPTPGTVPVKVAVVAPLGTDTWTVVPLGPVCV